MGITVGEDGSTRYVCLECGFSDDTSKGLRASDPRARRSSPRPPRSSVSQRHSPRRWRRPARDGSTVRRTEAPDRRPGARNTRHAL